MTPWGPVKSVWHFQAKDTVSNLVRLKPKWQVPDGIDAKAGSRSMQLSSNKNRYGADEDE
jgi:hypothetical protein